MKRKEFIKSAGIIMASGMAVGFSHVEETKAAKQISFIPTDAPKPFPI